MAHFVKLNGSYMKEKENFPPIPYWMPNSIDSNWQIEYLYPNQILGKILKNGQLE